MTSGAIYGNFAGKSDLLLEVIDSRIHQQLEVFPRAGADHLADVLAEMYESYPDRAEMRALLLEGAVAARGDREVRQRLHDGQVASLDRWAGAYDDLQEQGDIAADLDAQGVLRLLWALELGLGVLEALDLDLPDPAQAARIVGRMVAGLAATDGTS
jgi:AcrR family transcriptional regulator